MNTNSENPKVGKAFQNLVLKSMAQKFGIAFISEKPIAIGSPPKDHKFDCVSVDDKIVVECKCYTWTTTGNVPSAKLIGLDEAVFYMSYLPASVAKIICIKKSTYPGKSETLAQYYCRVKGHLLRDVQVYEADELGSLNRIR